MNEFRMSHPNERTSLKYSPYILHGMYVKTKHSKHLPKINRPYSIKLVYYYYKTKYTYIFARKIVWNHQANLMVYVR